MTFSNYKGLVFNVNTLCKTHFTKIMILYIVMMDIICYPHCKEENNVLQDQIHLINLSLSMCGHFLSITVNCYTKLDHLKFKMILCCL